MKREGVIMKSKTLILVPALALLLAGAVALEAEAGLFGRDKDGGYLDYYASHRMTSDSYVRIHSDGKVESFPVIESERVVHENPEEDKRLKAEWITEFDYQPTKCSRSYRVIVLRKEVEVTSGQQKLFDDEPYFFYITGFRILKLNPVLSRPHQKMIYIHCGGNNVRMLSGFHRFTIQ